MPEPDLCIKLTGSDLKLVSSLVAARAAIDAALVGLAQEPLPQSPAVPVPAPATGSGITCKHEHRTDRRTFGVTEAWECDDCGYEFRR
jgi:hypothetical protein